MSGHVDVVHQREGIRMDGTPCPFCTSAATPPRDVWRVRTTEDGYPCLVVQMLVPGHRLPPVTYEIDPAVFYGTHEHTFRCFESLCVEPLGYTAGQWRRTWNEVLRPPARAIR